jgi:hypothetical protein
MKYTDYVRTLRQSIIAATKHAKSNGTDAMSESNLQQITHFPLGAANAYMANQAFREALQFTIDNDLLAIRIY